MIPTETQMAQEAAEAPAIARMQLERNRPLFAELGRRLRGLGPALVTTGARGSSGHAARHGKTLIELGLGLPVATLAPSTASLYQARLRLRGQVFIAVSQSGRSPDLLALAQAAREGGALCIAFVNDENSPLAEACELAVPLCAGVERSVAATKTCLAAFLAFAHLVACWRDDPAALAELRSTPDWLEQAAALDWRPGLAALAGAQGLHVVARGLALGAAHEIALKCQETCRLRAQAFSAAEILHGPMAAIAPGALVLGLAQADATQEQTRASLRELASQGASLIQTGGSALPMPADIPPAVAPLAMLQSFYLAIPHVALARGLDPDRPGNLRKVTQTL